MQTVSWAVRDVPMFSMTVMMGLRIARLKPGEAVRFRITTGHGAEQKAASDYIIKGTLAAVEDAIAREQWPAQANMDGEGIVVRRISK